MFRRQLGLNCNTLYTHYCLVDHRTFPMLYLLSAWAFPCQVSMLGAWAAFLSLHGLVAGFSWLWVHPPPQTSFTLSFPQVPCKAALSLLAFEWRGEWSQKVMIEVLSFVYIHFYNSPPNFWFPNLPSIYSLHNCPIPHILMTRNSVRSFSLLPLPLLLRQTEAMNLGLSFNTHCVL